MHLKLIKKFAYSMSTIILIKIFKIFDILMELQCKKLKS